MAADYSLKCMGAERMYWLIYSACMMLVYPFGIPTMFAILLWKERSVLCPELEARGLSFLFVKHRLWSEDNKSNAENTSMAFLASAYEPHVFWFEVSVIFPALSTFSKVISTNMHPCFPGLRVLPKVVPLVHADFGNTQRVGNASCGGHLHKPLLHQGLQLLPGTWP